MKNYETQLQTAFRLALLSRGDLNTINFNPEYSCESLDFCDLPLISENNKDKASHQRHWMTQEAESFPHNSPDIDQLIQSLGMQHYEEITQGLAMLKSRGKNASTSSCRLLDNGGEEKVTHL